MRLAPILIATKLLFDEVNTKLAARSRARVPIAREGETTSVASNGCVYWDYVEEKPTDNASEPAQSGSSEVSRISVLPLTVYAIASDPERRGELEEAVLDVLTPKGDDRRRRPYGGWRTLEDGTTVEFHSIFHRSTVTIPGAKQGQDGPEVPCLLLQFTAQIEVTDPEE